MREIVSHSRLLQLKMLEVKWKAITKTNILGNLQRYGGITDWNIKNVIVHTIAGSLY